MRPVEAHIGVAKVFEHIQECVYKAQYRKYLGQERYVANYLNHSCRKQNPYSHNKHLSGVVKALLPTAGGEGTFIAYIRTLVRVDHWERSIRLVDWQLLQALSKPNDRDGRRHIAETTLGWHCLELIYLPWQSLRSRDAWWCWVDHSSMWHQPLRLPPTTVRDPQSDIRMPQEAIHGCCPRVSSQDWTPTRWEDAPKSPTT